jgi:hypothetical protein
VKLENTLYEIIFYIFAILLQIRPQSEEKGHQNVSHTLEADVRTNLPFHAFLHVSWHLVTENFGDHQYSTIEAPWRKFC